MKRGRVQAQRKFAQGAAIPPAQTTNNNTVERLRKEEISSIMTFHNKMSATTLLDAISFKNLHVHVQNKELEPVVRLERIESKTSTTREFSSRLLKKAKFKNRKPQAPKFIVDKKKMVRVTRSTSNMIIRKRHDADDIDDDTPLKFLRNSSFDTKRSPQQLKRKKIKRVVKQKPILSITVKTESDASPVTQTSFNDKMVAIGAKLKRTRSSLEASPRHNNDSRNTLSSKPKRTRSNYEVNPRTQNNNDDKDAIMCNKRSHSRYGNGAKIKQFAMQKPPRHQTSKTGASCLTQNGNNDVDRKRSSARRMRNDTNKRNQQSYPQVVSNGKIKKPIKQNRKLKSRPQKVSSISNNKNHVGTGHSKFKARTSEEGGSASATGVNCPPETSNKVGHKMPTEASETTPNIPDTPSDVPVLLESITESLTLPEPSTSEGHASTHMQCPSLKFATAKEVMDAPLCDLKELCHNCSQCSRVDKVVEIARLVETPIDIDSDSMDLKLHYSDEDEQATTTPDIIENQQESPDISQNAGEGTSYDVIDVDDDETPPAENASYLYLDILPPTAGTVIQIKSSKIPNQEKQLIIARLMPRSTNGENEFNLVEHENLLDQLLETLNGHKSNRNNGTSVANDTESATTSATNPTTTATDTTVANNTTPLETSVANNAIDADTDVVNEVTTDDTCVANDTIVLDTAAAKDTKHTTVANDTEGASKVVEDENIIDLSVENDIMLHNEVGTVADSKLETIAQASSTELDYCIPSTSQADIPVKSEMSTSDLKTKKSDIQSTNKYKAGFPKTLNRAKLVDAPVYYPTEAEFTDPVAYFEKIMPKASKYGICKVVAPSSFKPKCTINDKIRFNVSNQYIARLYSRWGLASKEMCAIKAYLASQCVPFTRAPFLDGLEVDLPKLYRTVQKHGGLNSVIEKKRWTRVAEEMRIAKGPKAENKLDTIYVRYLLPYDTLSNHEREQIAMAVTKAWHKRNQKIQDRALNPLHRQKQLLGESETSEDDTEEETDVAGALTEAEDCVVTGRRMTLSTFINAADVAAETYFPANSSPKPDEVETEYWRVVLHGTDHVCVYTASIDTGEEGYGFPKNKTDEYAKHPWNLKMMSQNSGNVLRSLGSVLGVTVPTLHVGMMFSTSCWHRDPHGLPWIEYMHNGPAKIWYGIPDEQSDKFRHAVEVLCPSSCQNKSIWLPSDITMIPPHFLLDQGVSLSRVEQRPGEFIIVFPRAYSCSICTGYTQSESVYFATASWLKTVDQVFQELRDSCEPTMFSLERVLMSIARDSRSPLCVLQAVHLTLSAVVEGELQRRRELLRQKVVLAPVPPAVARRTARMHRRRPAGAWNLRDQDECEVCRATLYLSKVTGLSDNKAAVCLQHALQLLARRATEEEISLVLFYSDEELDELVGNLQRSFAPRD